MPEPVLSEPPAENLVRRDAVAPWPHTVLLLTVLGAVTAYGARFFPLYLTAHVSRSLMYVSQMTLTWLLAGSTVAGLYHRRKFIASMLGEERLRLFRDMGGGFLIYLGGMAVALALGISRLFSAHLTQNKAIVSAIAPHGAADLPLWMLVSATAGVCEEFIFRGYLLRQFLSWSGRAWVAVVLSGLVFACMHLYEGSAAVLQIGGLGMFYGIIAVRRGNLRQVMIAHFFQDALTGLFLYLRH